MKALLAGLACTALLAGCEISTQLTRATPAPKSFEKKAERPTGSNIARIKRDPDLEGWRQGMDRDDMAKMQRSGGSRAVGGGF